MDTKRDSRSSAEPVIVTSFRMSPDQHEALKAIASSQHRTLSQEVRVALDAHIEAHKLPEAA